MTSECKHRSYQTVPMNGRKCNDCGRWLDDKETAMTSEEHQSILKAAVSYAIEETKRVCFAEMDKAMAELTEGHVASAKDAIQRARAEQAAELAKFKALAETLAGAMRRIHKTASHPTNPSRNLVDIKSVSDLALHKYDAVLRQYKEATQ